MANGRTRPLVWKERSTPGVAPKFAHELDGVPSSHTDIVLSERMFNTMLTLERRRAERSRKPFVLMLLDATSDAGPELGILKQAINSIVASKRETDLVGWYDQSGIVGVIFTEINIETEHPITKILRAKIEESLIKNLGQEKASLISISLHMFPESWDPGQIDRISDSKLYPDLDQEGSRNRLPLMVKRLMDMAGSFGLLLVLSPILAVIAFLIKVTSDGPVIFKQERLGQFGTKFKCLKFRTMYSNNDPQIHQKYVQQFIAGNGNCDQSTAPTKPVYKLINDPRVTAVGRFLRKTSLDELPQFWNVVRGEMSLVGPRPPVPYEFEIYELWHRRRVLEVKPGITGLWQVSGRSRTRFDEMVRLDLKYTQNWSLWLDLKILVSTPRAVFIGDGAC